LGTICRRIVLRGEFFSHMGLHGPIPFRDPARGNPGRRKPAGPKIPAEVLEQAKVIYGRELAMGDRFMEIEERRFVDDEPVAAPSPALWAALKCYREALYTAYRIAGVAEPEETDHLAAHLLKRPRPTRAG
jgi:hypothetical protein